MLLIADTSEMELWDRWTARREHDARDLLIQAHMSWARLVARDVYLRVRIRGADWADYAQNAAIGLLEAVDRYDPARGVDFRTYARHRIRGSVFNGLRHLASVPQSQPARPGVSERSASLSTDEEDSVDAFVSWTVGIGIGHLLEAASLMDQHEDLDGGPYAVAVHDQLKVALRHSLDKLSRRERMVLTLHYFQFIPFVDIAKQLQVTKGRVSQIHRQAIEAMRLHMRESIPAGT